MHFRTFLYELLATVNNGIHFVVYRQKKTLQYDTKIFQVFLAC